MAGRITLWGAGQMLNAHFGKSADIPANYYLAMIRKIPPTPYVSGAELDEPEGLGYTRAVIPNNLTYWSNAGQIQVSVLNSDVVYAPATGDWGDLKYWALCNAEVEGYVYFIGSLESQIRINNTDSLIVGAGDLGVTVGPFFTSEDA